MTRPGNSLRHFKAGLILGNNALKFQILIHGQSNAILFAEADGWAGASRLTSEVQRLLSFDGVDDTVQVLHASGEGQRGTAHGGTAFLGD